MHRICFFILLIVLCCTTRLFSQESKLFSTDPLLFAQEISLYISATDNKAYREKSAEQAATFNAHWLTDRFSHEVKDSLIALANVMREKQLGPFPFFFNYLKVISAFANSDQQNKSIIAWAESAKTTMGGRLARDYESYLEFTINLLEHNILNKTRTTEWKFSNGAFEFEYDGNTHLRFTSLNLICTTGNDSSVIINTSGTYDLKKIVWQGNKGRISWSRAGWEPDKVYADIIGSYTLNINDSKFTIDSVSLNNSYFFKEPLLGYLEERVLSGKPNERGVYPQFRSYLNNYFIEGVFPGINFNGGIIIKGNKFMGHGTSNEPASVSFLRNNSEFIVVRSSDFMIDLKKIVAQKASVAVYLESDSIYHPGLNMKYNHDENKLDLFRSDIGVALSPFYDSYHKVDIYCDMIAWKTNSDTIEFTVKSGLSKEHLTTFKSANFFSEDDYYKLQGIDPINPLNLVSRYASFYKTNEVSLPLFADFIKKPVEQASAMLFMLAAGGFVVYNPEEETAIIKPRLFDYLKAKAGKTDYDNIKFNSYTAKESNAVLDVNTNDLKIKGVDRITLSDSQNVKILPEDRVIVMKKNRDFTFSGNVDAGYFHFYSKEGTFQYDSFRINLPKIDSMMFDVVVKSKDPQKPDMVVPVKNVIADLTGDIIIDLPINKSGRFKSGDYPVFNSKSDSYVYFDYSFIKNGAYDRNRFYYHIDPFTIYKLDNFSTEDIRFEGYLASDSVFPFIEEPLVVLPGFDLGFEHQVPERGYPVYKGKGTFYNRLNLGNNGLIGVGKLNYLTSLSESAGFVFYLDSMESVTDKFNILSQQTGTEYPAVESNVSGQFWLPYEDVMTVSKINNPFRIFEINSEFHGQLILTPDNLTGNGMFNFSKAQVLSNLFDFNYITLTADTSDFQLKTERGEPAIETSDYRSFIDFENREGRFSALGRRSIVSFPYNKYISSMDEMLWDMDQEQITLINNAVSVVSGLEGLSLADRIDVDFTGSEFVSTHPDQDSLAFYCLKATYDMASYVIFTEGVQIIRVADAAIFPGNGKVIILEDAVMDTLRDANIIADTANKYHVFYNALVNITSRHKYHALAHYDYIDRTGKVQQLFINRIGVNENGTTVALSHIPDSAIFYLSPEFNFIGDITVYGNQEFPSFSGGYRLNQECYFTGPTWARFDTLVNPAKIFLPVHKKCYNIDGTLNEVGICRSESTALFNPAFFTPKSVAEDITVIRGNGVLTWDGQKSSFFVGTPGRIDGTSYLGNLLQLITSSCMIKGSGLIDLGVDYHPFEITSIGEIEHYIIPDSTTLRTSLILNFPFDEKLLESMADSLRQEPRLLGLDMAGNRLKPMLINLLGEKEGFGAINDYEVYGSVRKFPEKLRQSIVIADVKLKWYPSESSYISYGKIGISNILDKQVSKYVDGYIEIERRRSADAITIYLQASDNNWYFFEYKSFVLQAYASDQNFNDKLTAIERKDRTMKVAGENHIYEYVVSTRRKQIDFLRKMEYFNLNQ